MAAQGASDPSYHCYTVTPLSTFSLWCDGRYRIKVIIWNTIAQLRRSYRATLGPGRAADQVTAACYSDTRPLRGSLVAEVHFAKAYLGVGMVAHELSHATFRWMEKRGFPVSGIKPVWKCNRTDPEERFCYCLDRLCRGLWSQVHRRKLV
jgi:hypothetical protein